MRASAGKRRVAVAPDRCPECGASYARFRGGMATDTASAMLTADIRADDGSATYAVASELRSEDYARAAGSAGAAMRLAGEVKRAAWSEQHGPGRCRFDVEGFIIDYRRAMTGVVILDDREWRLREVIADLLLDDEDTTGEESSDADVSFDADAFAVPEWIDDGQHTTYIAA